MNKNAWYLIQFDIFLAKSIKDKFYQDDINYILNKVILNKIEQKYILDIFLLNNFLIKDNNIYYYTLEKINSYSYNTYKNYKKIISILEKDILEQLDFSTLII
jgi:hypothetical protein